MKKFLKVAFVAISALALFAGCKQNGDPSNKELPKSVGTNPFVNEDTKEDFAFFEKNSVCYYFTKDKVIVGRSLGHAVIFGDIKTANEVDSEIEEIYFPYDKYNYRKEYSYSWNTETNLLVLKPYGITDIDDDSGELLTIEEYAKITAKREFDEEYQKNNRRIAITERPIGISDGSIYNIARDNDEAESSEDEKWNEYWAKYIAVAKVYYGLEESATIDDLVKASAKEIYATESKLEYYSYSLGYVDDDEEEKYLSLSSFTKPGLSLVDYYKEYGIPNSFCSDPDLEGVYILINSEIVQVYSEKDKKEEWCPIVDVTDSVIKTSGSITEIPYTASLDDEDPSKWTIKVSLLNTEFTLTYNKITKTYPEGGKR